VCVCVRVCVRARVPACAFLKFSSTYSVPRPVCHPSVYLLHLKGSLTGIPSTCNFPRCDAGLKTDDVFGYSIVFVVKTHAGRHQSSKLVVSLRVRFNPWVQPMVEHVIFHGVRSYDALRTDIGPCRRFLIRDVFYILFHILFPDLTVNWPQM
jgi:hypothetical protein